MTFGFALLTAGSLLIYSGWSNSTIAEVMRGLAVSKSGPGDVGFTTLIANIGTGTAEAVSPSGGDGPVIGGKGHPHKKEQVLRESHPELKPGIIAVVAVILARFPELEITSTTGGSHATNSLHYEGRAVDLGGSPAVMRKAAKWIARYLTGVLTEGIHNPGLSVKDKKKVPPSFWGSETWNDHTDHIHVGV